MIRVAGDRSETGMCPSGVEGSTAGIIDSGTKHGAGAHAAPLCIPVEGSDTSLVRVGAREGGRDPGRAKSARVMPGDLSPGQFVIVCQPLYTVNTTNCRLIQMSVEPRAELASSDVYPPRLSKRVASRNSVLYSAGLLICLINLAKSPLPLPLPWSDRWLFRVR